MNSANPQPPTPNLLAGVVLPAGGSGRRLGGEPKQFRRLGDAPVLVQTARAFGRHPEVGPVVVVAPEADVEATRRMLGVFAVEARVVAGGETRARSVGCGLEALPAETDVVLVHDAVRPFVSADLVARVIAAVRAHGAAAAAVRVSDTLRRGLSDRAGSGARQFGETVDRDGLWAMQTPQGARRALLEAAYAAASARDEAPTDEAGLLERAGTPVTIVEGDARNLKITTPTGWALAETLWPSWATAIE